jgi:hypothetical protein
VKIKKKVHLPLCPIETYYLHEKAAPSGKQKNNTFTGIGRNFRRLLKPVLAIIQVCYVLLMA